MRLGKVFLFVVWLTSISVVSHAQFGGGDPFGGGGGDPFGGGAHSSSMRLGPERVGMSRNAPRYLRVDRAILTQCEGNLESG